MVDKKKSFEEWLDEAEWPDAEESARMKTERESNEGKCFRTVTLNEDESLFVLTVQYFQGGGSGEGSSIVRPADPNYEELLQEHGHLEVGKAHTIVRKLVDGNWVILPQSDAKGTQGS